MPPVLGLELAGDSRVRRRLLASSVTMLTLMPTSGERAADRLHGVVDPLRVFTPAW